MCGHNVEALHVKLVVPVLPTGLSWVKITKQCFKFRLNLNKVRCLFACKFLVYDNLINFQFRIHFIKMCYFTFVSLWYEIYLDTPRRFHLVLLWSKSENKDPIINAFAYPNCKYPARIEVKNVFIRGRCFRNLCKILRRLKYHKSAHSDRSMPY
jgi:hypothetical protein